MEYTKGGWKVDDTGTAIFSGGRLVANCGGFQLSQHEPSSLAGNKANARLIVAAPLMYEALKGVLGDEDNGSFTTLAGNVRKLVEKALAKAEEGEK